MNHPPPINRRLPPIGKSVLLRALSLLPPALSLIVLIPAQPVLAQYPPTGPIQGGGPSGIITTVAGGQFQEGGRADKTPIQVIDMDTDSSGNLYLLARPGYIGGAGEDSEVIYRVTPSGTISRYAGGGAPQVNGGDGGPATLARIESHNLAVGPGDAVYLINRNYSETGPVKIRKIGADGTITTVVQFEMDPHVTTLAANAFAIDQKGNFYFFRTDQRGVMPDSEMPYTRLVKLSPSGVFTPVAFTNEVGYFGDGGSAVQAQMTYSSGIDFDEVGNLYVADTGNNCIRRVSPDGIVTTVAGVPSTWKGGYGGDGGPALAARFNRPTDVRADALGNLYIADMDNQRIRKVDPSGIIRTVAGNGYFTQYPPTADRTGGYSGDGGPAVEAMLNRPLQIALGGEGSLYIDDSENRRVRKVDARGTISTFAGAPTPPVEVEGSPALNTTFQGLTSLAPDGEGGFYTAEATGRIRRITPDGTVTTVETSAHANPAYPRLAIQRQGDLYLTGYYKLRSFTGFHSVLKLDTRRDVSHVAGKTAPQIPGASDGDGGPAASAGVGLPGAITLDAAGNLYIAEGEETYCKEGSTNPKTGFVCTVYGVTGGHRIRKVSPDGTISTFAGTGASANSGDGGPATSAALHNPVDMTVDGGGNLLILTPYDIRKVNPAGIISTLARFTPSPNDAGASFIHMEVDSSGTIFLGGARQIRRLEADATLTPIIGTNALGIEGDGGPASLAQFFEIRDFKIDSQGNILLAEPERIRKVFGLASPGLFAGAPFPPRRGDVDRDGIVAIGDVIRVLKSLVGLADLPAEDRPLADLDRNGSVTLTDAILILRVIVHLDVASSPAPP